MASLNAPSKHCLENGYICIYESYIKKQTTTIATIFKMLNMIKKGLACNYMTLTFHNFITCVDIDIFNTRSGFTVASLTLSNVTATGTAISGLDSTSHYIINNK